MLQKVTPLERGIPTAKNFYINYITATHAKLVFDAVGYPQSTLKNFVVNNSTDSAEVLGTIGYIEGWKYNNFSISIDKAAPPAKVKGDRKRGTIKINFLLHEIKYANYTNCVLQSIP